jgi:hypothetical protein
MECSRVQLMVMVWYSNMDHTRWHSVRGMQCTQLQYPISLLCEKQASISILLSSSRYYFFAFKIETCSAWYLDAWIRMACVAARCRTGDGGWLFVARRSKRVTDARPGPGTVTVRACIALVARKCHRSDVILRKVRRE